MPKGLITDVLSLALGGVLGSFTGTCISKNMKDALNLTFGFCAIAIGIRLIVKMDNLSVVILSVVLGTIIGECMKLEQCVHVFVEKIALKFLRHTTDTTFISSFCAVTVLFCCSGTGWYGVLHEGFTGDSSILITKAILDFFTAIIFSAVLGKLVPFLAAPQLIIYLFLFSISRLVFPYITSEMINDFSAVGGIVELTTGMRITGIKREVKPINMIPAMVIVFPISAICKAIINI